MHNSLEENKSKYPVQNIIEDVVALRKNLASLPERVVKQMGQNVIRKIFALPKEAVKEIIVDEMKDLIKYLFLGEAARQIFTYFHLLS